MQQHRIWNINLVHSVLCRATCLLRQAAQDCIVHVFAHRVTVDLPATSPFLHPAGVPGLAFYEALGFVCLRGKTMNICRTYIWDITTPSTYFSHFHEVRHCLEQPLSRKINPFHLLFSLSRGAPLLGTALEPKNHPLPIIFLTFTKCAIAWNSP